MGMKIRNKPAHSEEHIASKPQNNYDVEKYQKLLETERYLEINEESINDFSFKIKKLISYVVRVITVNKVILFKDSLDVENIDPHLLKYDDKNEIGEINGIISQKGKKHEFATGDYGVYVCRHLSYAKATEQISCKKLKDVQEFMKQPFFNETIPVRRPLSSGFPTRWNEVNDTTFQVTDLKPSWNHVLLESTLEDISELASILLKEGDECNSSRFKSYISLIEIYRHDHIVDTKGIKIKDLINPNLPAMIKHTEMLIHMMTAIYSSSPYNKDIKYKLQNGLMTLDFAIAFLLSKQPLSGDLVAQDNPDGYTYSCSFNSFNKVLKELSTYVWNKPVGHCENFNVITMPHVMSLSIKRYENNLKISFFDPNNDGKQTNIIVDSLEEINKIDLPMLTSLSESTLKQYGMIGADAKSKDLHLITLVNFRKLDNYKSEFTDIFSFAFRQKYRLANLTKADLSAIVEDCKQQQIKDFPDKLQHIIETNLSSSNDDTPLAQYKNQEELINSIFQAIKDSLAKKDVLFVDDLKSPARQTIKYIAELIEVIFIKHLSKYCSN